MSHSLWVPLRLHAADPAPRAGAPIKVFGRLAPGVELAEAQAELAARAQRAAEEFPDTHRHIRPVVKPYVESLWSAVEDAEIQTVVLYAANLFFIGLLAVCAANVATLVFARTAARESEISVRTALGASRARIAGQLFVEAAVLSSAAAVLGLAFAYYALQWVRDSVTAAQQSRLMFWWNDALSPQTFVYAGVLAAVAALIVGVVPALKATGRNVQDVLKHAGAGSTAGLRFGGVWTGVVVVQAGLTVVFLAMVGTLGWGFYFHNAGDRALAVPASEYVVMRLNLDREPSATAMSPDEEARSRARLGVLYEAFSRRAAAEAGVRAVAFGSRLPGMNHPVQPIEIAGNLDQAAGVLVRTALVSVGLLDTLQASLVAGRMFIEADLAPGREVAIVDQSFVRHVLGGGGAVGRQFRTAARNVETTGDQRLQRLADGEQPETWVEIIGVVRDLTVESHKTAGDAVVYRPAAAGSVTPLRVAVRVAGPMPPVMWRLRVIAAEVNAGLRLDDMQTLDQVHAADRVAIEFFLRLLAGIGAVALVLATAGIYALMSFTVAQRAAEIGIRLALGAGARRIVITTFARALAQVSAGVAAGVVPAAALAAAIGPEVAISAGRSSAALIAAAAGAITVGVTALACVAPARRALRIQPIEILKVT